MRAAYPALKRGFDFIVAALGLLVLLPLGLVLAALIKLAGPGPIFYGQTRVGQFGKPFRMWKFRSMVVDADRMGAAVTQGGDPRVTPIGRVLRKAKLDELPQLWNVLVGEMSFVGPRPEVAKYVELYTEAEREVLRYKPGITDLASLLFRNEESLLRGTTDLERFYTRYCLPRKIALNLEYAQRASLWRDIGIILRTICPHALVMLGAYSLALLLSFGLAYLIHSDFEVSRQNLIEFLRFAPVVVLPQLLFLAWKGEFAGVLSYFSIPELRRTATCLIFAMPVQAGLCYGWPRFHPPRFSILLMDLILSFFALCAWRMGCRMLREYTTLRRSRSAAAPRKVGIIGTGEVATNLVLDFKRSCRPRREVVAFFDDNPQTWHKRPHGIPVVGMPECLLSKEWSGQLDEIIVTLPEESVERIRELTDMLRPLHLKITLASGWPELQEA